MDNRHSVSLRSVTLEDMDLLFEWVNDNLTRKSAFHSEPILYEEHKDWFVHMLNNQDILAFIFEVDGKPVGQTRVEIGGTIAEIDYSICTDEREKDYAKEMLTLLAELLSKERPDIQKIRAKVKPENDASRHVFSALHYTESYVCYEKSIQEIHGERGTLPKSVFVLRTHGWCAT